MTDQANPYEEATLDPYQQLELHGEDLEQHLELGLPQEHPHVFAQALLGQLARLPLMDLEDESELFSAHTVALSA